MKTSDGLGAYNAYERWRETRGDKNYNGNEEFTGALELGQLRDALPVVENELHEFEVYFREDEGWPEDEMPDSVIELRDRIDIMRSRLVILEVVEEDR
jgi:hypothetical protein